MRKTWIALRCLGAFLFMGAGCWTTGPSLKPPPQPEVYALPPQDDPRFSEPISYPKDTLNQDVILKRRTKNQQQGDGPPSAPRLSGSGMGGGY